MRKRHRGADFAEVDVVSRLVFGVRVGFVNLVRLGRVLLYILHGLVVNLENAVLAAGFDSHVRHAQAVVHGKVG